jgi:hypothetical protein
MNLKKIVIYCITIIMLLSMSIGVALAEDGVLFRRNISKTPDNETEKSAIYMMDFYVPAQASTGLVGAVDNYLLDDGIDDNEDMIAYDARDYAKPLITVWIDDLHPEDSKGGITFGHFDAFAGVSLDDGTSWKTTNLSRSSDLSSFNLANGYAYPGDVHNVVHQVKVGRHCLRWISLMLRMLLTWKTLKQPMVRITFIFTICLGSKATRVLWIIPCKVSRKWERFLSPVSGRLAEN